MKSFFNSFALNRCELKFNFGVIINLLVVFSCFFLAFYLSIVAKGIAKKLS